MSVSDRLLACRGFVDCFERESNFDELLLVGQWVSLHVMSSGSEGEMATIQPQPVRFRRPRRSKAESKNADLARFPFSNGFPIVSAGHRNAPHRYHPHS